MEIMIQPSLIKSKITKLINLLVLLLIMLIFNSCNLSSDKRMIGFWTIDIDSTQVIGREFNISDNILTIEMDSTCILPNIMNQIGNKSNTGKWKMLFNDKNDTIYFNVPENPLNGKYAIHFYRDYKEKLFKARLTNDSTIIVCRKGLQDFDKNIDW